MISKRTYFIYSIILVAFIGGIVWILLKGGDTSAFASAPVDSLINLSWNPFTNFIFQALVILFLSRLFGSISRTSGQPALTGEIVAGVLLGPSILGWLFPSVYEFLFPASSFAVLEYITQLGLLLFLFIIGMELDVKVLRSRHQRPFLISHLGILIPFALGVLLAYYWYLDFAPSVNFYGFALFLGIGISVSAFPVLARIIQERGLIKKPIGSLAITAASIDDITAWSLVALAVAVVKADGLLSFLITLLFIALYFVFMIMLIMPIMKKIGELYPSKETLNKRVMGSIFGMLILSVAISELIGLDGLIGAFFAGVIMPRNLSFKKILNDRIEDITVALFLPLLFLYVGLHTNLHIFFEWNAIAFCGLVLIASLLGKLLGVTLTSKTLGGSWKDSFLLGVLMNTRGLMGLIIITLGHQLNVFPETLFTVLVVLVFIATLITNPLLDLLLRKKPSTKLDPVRSTRGPLFKILVSFGIPKMGSTLLRLADQLTQRTNPDIDITALHITPSSEVKPLDAILFEKEGFQPIRATAHLLEMKLTTIYKTTHEVEREILRTARQDNFDLVLVGAARPVFNERMTGGKLAKVLDERNLNIGVLMDNGYVLPENILMLVATEEDSFLLEYAKRFYKSSKSRITILSLEQEEEILFINRESKGYTLPEEFNEVIKRRIPDKDLLEHFNLVLVSFDCWNALGKARATWIKDCPSVLVMKAALP